MLIEESKIKLITGGIKKMIARVAAIKDFSNLVKFSFFKKKFIEKFLSKIFPLEDMERSKNHGVI